MHVNANLLTSMSRDFDKKRTFPSPECTVILWLLEGDVRVEAMILQFIAERYGVRDLLHLPAKVAEAALKRPADFIRAAKNHCEPELKF